MSKCIISEELKQLIIDFYLAPNSIRETARYFNISYNIIRRKLQEWNMTIHDHKTLVKLSLNQMIKTNLEKYGVEHVAQSEVVLSKMKATCIERYGAEWSFGSSEIKEKIQNTFTEKYGSRYLLQNKVINNKVLEMKRKNNTLNASKPEDLCFEKLLSKYSSEDIERNYNKDKRYPFMCDFYIKSLDLFIELNFHWTHGFHLFDKNNRDDIALVEKWKAKNTKYYTNAVNTWTIRDVKKYNTATKNNLNYLVFYTEKDFNIWLNS